MCGAKATSSVELTRRSQWYIDWGDGVTETGNYTHLLPVHQEYTYLVGGTYTITFVR
jgi:hypothetical protein